MATPLLNDPISAACLQLVNGEEAIYKFGRRDSIGLTFEDIAPAAAYAGFIDPAVAATLSLVSDNIADDVASTGCQVLRVVGLDANLALQIKDYNMDGTVPVVTTGDLWSRVWRLRSRQSDDRRIPNVGIITANSTSAGTPLMANMSPSVGSSLSTNFTMPAGMSGVVNVVGAGVGNNKVGDIRILSSEIITAFDRPFDVELNLPVTAGPSDVRTCFFLPEKTDFIAEALALTGTVDAFISYIIYVLTNRQTVLDAPLFNTLTT